MKMGEFKKMKTEGDDSVILAKGHKTMPKSVVTNLCHRSLPPPLPILGATNDNDSISVLEWRTPALS